MRFTFAGELVSFTKRRCVMNTVIYGVGSLIGGSILAYIVYAEPSGYALKASVAAIWFTGLVVGWITMDNYNHNGGH